MLRTHLVILFLILTFPILAIPFILREVYFKRYYALNYLAVFMGLLAYLWIPSGDLYRYYNDFIGMESLSWSSLSDIFRFDFIHPCIMFLISHLGLDFGFVRLSLSIVCYLLLFSIFKDVIRHSNWLQTNKDCFIAFLTLFFLIRFSGFLTGVRFTLAMALSFYGAYWTLHGMSKKGWVCLFLSGFTHFSLWAITFMVIFIKLVKPSFYKNTTLFLLFFLFLFSPFFLVNIIEVIPVNPMLKLHLENYTIGYYAGEELQNHSILFKIAQICSIFALYPSVMLLFYRMNKFKNFELFVCLAIFLVLLWNMNSAYNRYAFLATIFFILPFFRYGADSFKKSDLYFMFLVSLFVYSTSILTTKRELINGRQVSIIYMPLPAILSNTYSSIWINTNIMPDGDMRYN
ncbi:EpsG family protein [Bacteroides sp. GD17]|uniref:EpsG family protein n=1 Tax=Bacteroides sp. GD17 TaxID=3139826 RepID=UPI00313D6628